MRGLLAATAVTGVLVIGGLPALALTLAEQETGPDGTVAAAPYEPGPPAWAHGNARGHQKPGKGDRDEAKDKTKDAKTKDKGGAPGWTRHDGQVPPGWARNHGGRSPHGWAMREWAHCVADATAGRADGAKPDPEAACGERPAPPPKSNRR